MLGLNRHRPAFVVVAMTLGDLRGYSAINDLSVMLVIVGKHASRPLWNLTEN